MSNYIIKRSELYHHGILGQKWGVRNGPPYPLSESEKSSVEKAAGFIKNHKKELIVGASIAAGALALYGGYKLYKSAGIQPSGFRTYGTSSSLKDCLSDYPSKDIIIGKTEKLQRVSSKAFEDLQQKGHIYVSHKFRDNKRYISEFRKEVNASGNLDFVHKLIPKEDLKIASPKKAAEIYLQQHPNATDSVFRNVINPYRWANENSELASIFNQQRHELIKELTKQGYSGILDLEDAVKVKGSEPIILFNPDSHVSVSNSRKIGEIETFIAGVLK